MAYLRQHWRKALFVFALPLLGGALVAACLAALVMLVVLGVFAALPALLLITCSSRSSTRLPAAGTALPAGGRKRVVVATNIPSPAAGRRAGSRRSQATGAFRSTGW
jgi:hypothetical protein